MIIIHYKTRHEDIAIGSAPGAMVTINRSYTPTLEHARAWDAVAHHRGRRNQYSPFESWEATDESEAYVIALLGMSLTDDDRNTERSGPMWDTVDRVEEAFEAMLRLDRRGYSVVAPTAGSESSQYFEVKKR